VNLSFHFLSWIPYDKTVCDILRTVVASSCTDLAKTHCGVLLYSQHTALKGYRHAFSIIFDTTGMAGNEGMSEKPPKYGA